MTAAVSHVPLLDARLVRRLVAGQFPDWAELPIRPVDAQGWDNRTFRLGPGLAVRLPSAAGYEPQVVKEQRWLPVLRRHVPLQVPEPVALGTPAAGYPFRWSVRTWIGGEVLSSAPRVDMARLAHDLGGFLAALRSAPAVDGPAAGPGTSFRGAPLDHYADEAREAAAQVLPADRLQRAQQVLAEALASRWDAAPVWFHGDVAVDNLLTRDGRLSAVIDFGVSGVGDPACDLVIAWTLLEGTGRDAFRDAVGLDDATWARGRGWALWKAVVTLRSDASPAVRRVESERVLTALLDP